MKYVEHNGKKIYLKDLNTGLDFTEQYMFESHIMHDLKRKGKEKFIEYYRDLTDTGYSNIELNFLVALLHHLGCTDTFDYIPVMDKYIITAFEFDTIERSLDWQSLKERLDHVLPEFFERGYIYDAVEEAV